VDDKLTYEQIQITYRDLCAELGHLSLVQENTTSRLQSIRTAIQELDKKAAALKEEEVKQASAGQAADAKNAAKPQAELKSVEVTEEVSK
jgi:hypothetical protein